MGTGPTAIADCERLAEALISLRVLQQRNLGVRIAREFSACRWQVDRGDMAAQTERVDIAVARGAATATCFIVGVECRVLGGTEEEKSEGQTDRETDRHRASGGGGIETNGYLQR